MEESLAGDVLYLHDFYGVLDPLPDAGGLESTYRAATIRGVISTQNGNSGPSGSARVNPSVRRFYPQVVHE